MAYAYLGVAMNLDSWRALNVGWAAKPSKTFRLRQLLKPMLGLAAQPTLGSVHHVKSVTYVTYSLPQVKSFASRSINLTANHPNQAIKT
jgi:hypothetical protein